MLLYEVTLQVEPALAAAVENHMRQVHIPEIFATGCFRRIRFHQASAGRFRTSYEAGSQAELDRYLVEHAPRLRAPWSLAPRYLHPMYRHLLAPLLLLAACDRSSGGSESAGTAACGLAALAGPTALLAQFGIPDQTLASPPRNLPERLVVRLVAGPAYPAIVGRSDSRWIIGVEGSLPPNVKPGFGVIVLDQSEKPRGILLYEGAPVEGAPEIGTVSISNATVPLIGIQLDPAKVEDPRCPLFPDTVIQ